MDARTHLPFLLLGTVVIVAISLYHLPVSLKREAGNGEMSMEMIHLCIL